MLVFLKSIGCCEHNYQSEVKEYFEKIVINFERLTWSRVKCVKLDIRTVLVYLLLTSTHTTSREPQSYCSITEDNLDIPIMLIIGLYHFISLGI